MGAGLKMPLEIHIEKKLPDFALNASFTADNAPLSILGPSGAGKTMLLRCIAGLEHPDKGRISLNGRVLFDADSKIAIPARERHVGMLFQHYALFPHRTVAQNIAFGLAGMSQEEQMKRATALMDRVHIADLGRRYPRELSGGEQQRAAIARALATEPEALLLDEPLSALDTHLRSQMEAQLEETFSEFERPVLLVTHNIEEAYRLGDQLLVLSRGRVAACGDKEHVFRHPATVEIARLTGCKNFSRAKAISSTEIEAIDWGCRLTFAHPIEGSTGHVGIRAHHVDFVEATSDSTPGDNIFPCWLVRSSETPFRTTLFLRMNQPSENSNDYHLQAEVFREKWMRFRDRSFPWHVRLSPDSLFLMPE
jgi:molybdate transport system permease protein